MTEYDEVNMVSAVLAKKMGAKRPSFGCGIRNIPIPTSRKKNILGFSLVVNPELLTARYIANIIDFPNALSVEHFANGRVALMEFKIKPDSNLCNMSLSIPEEIRNVIVCAIERGNEPHHSNGVLSCNLKTRFFVTGNRIEVVLFHNNVRPQVIKSMMIGAGKIAYYLLNILQDVRRKIDLKVLKSIANGRNSLVRNFPISMSSMETELLKTFFLEESANNFDAVATLTGVDEENIITSMFLNSVGVKRTLPRSTELVC